MISSKRWFIWRTPRLTRFVIFQLTTVQLGEVLEHLKQTTFSAS